MVVEGGLSSLLGIVFWLEDGSVSGGGDRGARPVVERGVIGTGVGRGSASCVCPVVEEEITDVVLPLLSGTLLIVIVDVRYSTGIWAVGSPPKVTLQLGGR